jgi:maltooligosyltrehalose trehalohydrolase
MDVMKKNIGVTFNSSAAQVRVWAPEAGKVELKLQHSDLLIALEKEERGYWSAATDQIAVGDCYWFILDGGKQVPDPASVAQPEGVHGPSQAINLYFDWSVNKEWQNIPLKDYILYELHTGTFSAGGDFEGIAERLDYLAGLGITAIEIMPVAAFPGTRNWGYDGVFPFAVQASYGGALGLQELVCLCHQKGLAVVLDVVYNHLGPEGNYLGEFGPYFTDKYRTPWGDAVNFDDRGCYGVREFFVENVLMWFRDFRIDALRLDAVHAIKDFGAVHILQEIRSKVDLLMEQTGRIHYVIAESDLNDPRVLQPSALNGLGMDAQWVDEFHHALRVAAGERRTGYYSDFNGLAHLAKSYTDAYVYTGEFSEERQRCFGRAAEACRSEQFVVFSQNHDQVGNRMLGERTSELAGFEMQKLLAGAVLLSPFLPMLFMGEEWAEKNPFLYFIDHTDPELVETVRKGRQEEFAAMHSGGHPPDPKSEETFLRSKLNWSLLEEGQHERMFEFYKFMIALRKKNVVLNCGERSNVRTTVLEDKGVLLLERGLTGSNEVLICLLNFSSARQVLSLPAGTLTCMKVADSADPQWLGPEAAPDQINPEAMPGAGENVTIQPESFIVYSAFYA